MDQENGLDPMNEQPQDAAEFSETPPVDQPEVTADTVDALGHTVDGAADAAVGSETPGELTADAAVSSPEPETSPDVQPEADLTEEPSEPVASEPESEPVAEASTEDVDLPADAGSGEQQPATDSQDEQPETSKEEDSPADVEPAAAEPVAEETPNALSGNPEAQWFVVHCYSGYENKVRHNLEQRIETMGMRDRIFDVVIPTQEEVEVKDGKRRVVERHVFPGYVLVNMLLSDESWFVVRNTPGVTGFVGMGNDPTPLRPDEVAQILKRMEAEAPHIKVTFKVGERVRIVDGPFNDFRGNVAEINVDRSKVRVMVNFFGRETPVELDFLQVERA